jgi:transcriptional regulator with PAS, ATPase and Fis domain
LLPLREFVRQVERHYILDVLGLHNGVKSRACERLQISRQTLYTKLNQELEREGA